MSDWLDEKMSEMGRDKCPTCSDYFKSIGHHWRRTTECEIDISNNQHKVITGLVMGDGCIQNRGGGRPYLVVGMITPEYLEYLNSSIFPKIGLGVKFHCSAEQSAKNALNLPGATGNPENYNDMYSFRTLSHSEFNEYGLWYSSGKKVWPSNIEMTPTTLKHWYCCDGYIRNNQKENKSAYLGISMSNEIKNKDKVSRIFKKSGLPEPRYDTAKRKNGTIKCDANFTVDQSKQLFEYMGKPLPGFEYKWPEQYRKI